MTNKLNSFTTKTIDLIYIYIYIYDLCSPVLFGIENFSKVPREAKLLLLWSEKGDW